MGMFREFKEFATKGNVLDLAVGIILGGAFGKIVSSLVEDILMPPIGYLVGGINFADIKITLHPPLLGPAQSLHGAVTINIGNFLQHTVDFLIISFAVFLIVKAANSLHHKPEGAPPPPPPADVQLLTEIRDLLRKGR
jgi:large conductance mechanosensitive channel